MSDPVSSDVHQGGSSTTTRPPTPGLTTCPSCGHRYGKGYVKCPKCSASNPGSPQPGDNSVEKSTPARRKALLALAARRRQNLRRIANGQKPLKENEDGTEEEVDPSELGSDAPASAEEARERLRKDLGPQTCPDCPPGITPFSGATYLTCPRHPTHVTALEKAFGFQIPVQGGTTVFKPDPRLHSHPFIPDPLRPAQCKDCGMGTGTHSRMVYRPPVDEEEEEPARKSVFRRMVAGVAKSLGLIDDDDPTSPDLAPYVTFPEASPIPLSSDLSYAVVKSSPESRYTLGPVYLPSTRDAHGEFATAEELQKATWEFVRTQPRTIYLQHSDQPAGEWVEIMAWPHPVTASVQIPGSDTLSKSSTTRSATFPAGTVYMGVVWENWAYELVKKGRLRGYSMGGYARRTEAELHDGG